MMTTIATCTTLLLLTQLAAAQSLPSTGHDNMPPTNFSCIGKVIGGYYADIYTNCQMFHVCTIDEKGKIHDYTFRCLAGTVFDQETRVCERFDEVDCTKSESFYHLNNDLYGPGIIPSTADSEGTSSAAKVQVLDPTVVLMGAPDPPTVPTDTSEATTPPASHSQPQPPSPPTSSPQPPVIPPGVTASTTRMSTSTSSSVTAAFSFPPLPFTVSRTSTSVSASSRVRIQTPLAQISLHQGVDHSVLPAPHLRPSLLRLAAEAQNAAQAARILEDHNPTSPLPVTAQTPANFEDVPKLSVFHSDTSATGDTNNSGGSSLLRRKRQLTPRSRIFSHSLTQEDGTLLTDTTPTSSRHINRDRTVTSTFNPRRTTSRGRKRIRPSNSHDEPVVVRQQVNVMRDNPLRFRQRNRVPVRQRGDSIQVKQDESSIHTRPQVRPTSNAPRISPVTNRQRDESAFVRQQGSSVLERQIEPSLGLRQQVRGRVSSRPVSHAQVMRHRPVHQTFTQDSSTDIPVHQDGIIPDSVTETPLQLADPTPVPPTVLTAEFPPDSHIRVFDGVEATSRTDFSPSTADITTKSPSSPPPPPPPPSFVFPETSFSCKDKVLGGLYADVETGCTVFHICSVELDSSTKDNKFVCGSGTLFDQKSRTCQIASAVDCAKAPSFYYLNEPLKGPVYVELEAQYPEQQFDFPRIPLSSLSSSQRPRRNTDDSVDLCRSRPLGTPLGDLTTGCQDYTVCEALSDNRVVEKYISCKKGYLFSQLRQRCVLAKKVDCTKETLGEILGLIAVRRQKRADRKRRAAALLQSHRFSRAALPPLANLIMTPGMEDARVRRALYNLAALQQWTMENARHTTFIEVYALQTDGEEGHYPKKVYVDNIVPLSSSEAVQRYGYIHRKKRDVANVTVAEQVLFGNKTKIEEGLIPSVVAAASGNKSEAEETKFEQTDKVTNTTSENLRTLPTIATTTIGSRAAVLPTFTVSRQKTIPSASFVTSTQPVIPTTLSTFTISPAHTASKIASTTTVTIAPVTVTVTTTKIIVPGSATSIQTEISPTGTTVATAATQSTTSLTTPLPVPSSSTTKVDSVAEITSTPLPKVTSASPNINTENNVSNAQSMEAEATIDSDPFSPISSTETQTTQPSVTESDIVVQNSTDESSTVSTTTLGIGDSPLSSTTPQSVAETPRTNVTESSESAASSSTTEVIPLSDVITTTAVTTTVKTENTDTEIYQTEKSIVFTNFTTTTTTTEVVFPSGSVNVSTTFVPDFDVSTSSSTTTETDSIVTPPGLFTRENLPETNFTCKDKKLEQFYPDPEANCQVFHYCSPGFLKKQVLDLKFLCTGATMFDVNTQKCEDMSSVTCGQEIPTNETAIIAIATTTEDTSQVPKYDAINQTVTKANVSTEATVTIGTETVLHVPVTSVNTTESSEITTETSSTTSTTEKTVVTPIVNDTSSEHTNWNSTESPHHLLNIKGTEETVITETTEQLTPETTTVTDNPQQKETKDRMTEIEIPFTTTIEPTEELVKETEDPETETVTDKDVKEEVSTRTEGFDDALLTTTEFVLQDDYVLQDDPEITTELGPFVHYGITGEAISITEEITDVSTTELNVDVAAVATTLDPSVSILETSTDISLSTDVPIFSNDSVSSETSATSGVLVSSSVKQTEVATL